MSKWEVCKSLLVDEALLRMGRVESKPLLHVSELPCMFAVLHVQVLILELPRWSANS